MYKIKIISVNKIKEKWLNEAIEEYEKRLSKELKITWLHTKNLDQLSKLCKNESFYICLDIKGKQFSSEKLSETIFDFFSKNKLKITIVIGDAFGLPDEVKNNANFLLSFSKLTFTHQIAHLLLIEQLYRSFEIKKGSSYHK